MYDLISLDGRNFLSDEYLIVNGMRFNNKESDDEVIAISETISESLQSNNRYKIAFDIISEGLPYNQISTCQKIIKHFIDKHNFVSNRFAFVFGALPCTENVNYYRQHCKRFDWVEVPAYFFNNWERHCNELLQNTDSPYHSIDITPRIKPKKFLCYNRNVKPHRLYITTELIDRGLLDKGYVSNYFNFDQHEFILNSMHETLPTKSNKIKKILYENRHLFPLDLGLGNMNGPSLTDRFLSLNNEDSHHFNDTYFGVITESKFAKDDYSIPNRIYTDISLDCYTLTEKTWKFVAAKKPFILAAFPGFLELIRRAGYQTFHPLIDETYDTVDDDEIRLELIVNEIERLCNLSDSEIIIWQHKINEIVTHNYNTLLNAVSIYTTFLPKT